MSEVWLSRGGKKFGPYAEAVVRAHYENGKVLPGDLIWKKGMSSWEPAAQALSSGDPFADPPSLPLPPPPSPALPAATTVRQVTVSMQPHGKNMVLAYVLWWFLGVLGIHRFYLGKAGTGVTQLILFIAGLLTLVIGVGLVLLLVLGVWWLLDAYFIQKYVVEHNRTAGLPASAVTLSANS